MSPRRYRSWGGYPSFPQFGRKVWWRSDPLPDVSGPDSTGLLPYGNGRSYGDVCLNEGGTVLDCRPLNRFIAFDAESGVVCCEAGVLLSEVLELVVPKGWFLPVTPGTRFVTVGGAIANDVHGKNHHHAGTFGRHVLRLELLRSDGSRFQCSRDDNPEWFGATVGGLGLTGLITSAEIQLKRARTAFIDQQVIRFANLEEFRQLSDESDGSFEYTVAWVDSFAKRTSRGRGLFIRGNHAEQPGHSPRAPKDPRLGIPFTPPVSLLHPLSLKILSSLYYRKPVREGKAEQVHLAPFFYPLDGVRNWNRVYGPKGFLQYQCVVPLSGGELAMEELLERIADSGEGSFITVLKRFGSLASPGLLSFPREGYTLALDFPNRGARTLELLSRLDEVTAACGGALNPSKDARMGSALFKDGFPEWKRLGSFIDPAFSSSFWRRVTDGNAAS